MSLIALFKPNLAIYEKDFVLSLRYGKPLLARFIILRATPPVLNTQPRKLKLDSEKSSKHAGLT
jgi:hypothetical protein